MAELRIHNVATSLDGYCAGPDQSIEDPLGRNGEDLHRWMFATRWGAEHVGRDHTDIPETIDDEILRRGDEGIGATIMGRNMFGPVRGTWDTWDGEWTGWWGPEPPYHHDVFVLTHHGRDPLPMAGGTTFHFVTDGIESALEQAVAAAGGADVRLAGGASVIRQYLAAGLVDHVHLPIVPILLGGGERPLDVPEVAERYRCTEVLHSPAVTHVFLDRTG